MGGVLTESIRENEGSDALALVLLPLVLLPLGSPNDGDTTEKVHSEPSLNLARRSVGATVRKLCGYGKGSGWWWFGATCTILQRRSEAEFKNAWKACWLDVAKVRSQCGKGVGVACTRSISGVLVAVLLVVAALPA